MISLSPAYEQGGDIEQELDKLELDVQGIIKLRFFEELSLKEISCITGLKLNTVNAFLMFSCASSALHTALWTASSASS